MKGGGNISLTTNMGVTIAVTDTNSGGYCSHCQQCREFLRPLAQVLAFVAVTGANLGFIAVIDTFARGYCSHWYQCWGFLQSKHRQVVDDGTSTGGYISHWHEWWGLLQSLVLTPMRGEVIITQRPQFFAPCKQRLLFATLYTQFFFFSRKRTQLMIFHTAFRNIPPNVPPYLEPKLALTSCSRGSRWQGSIVGWLKTINCTTP